MNTSFDDNGDHYIQENLEIKLKSTLLLELIEGNYTNFESMALNLAQAPFEIHVPS